MTLFVGKYLVVKNQKLANEAMQVKDRKINLKKTQVVGT